MPTRLFSLLFASAIAGLAGCQSVPTPSLIALSRVDPLALEADAIEAALVHPDTLIYRDRSAVLTLAAADPARGLAGHEAFWLLVESATDEPQGISRPDGALVTRFQIAPADRARFDAFMATVRDYRDAEKSPGAPKGQFTISLRSTPCWRDATANALSVVAYLKTNEKGRFRPVTQGVDLAEIAGEEIPLCTEGPASG